MKGHVNDTLCVKVLQCSGLCRYKSIVMFSTLQKTPKLETLKKIVMKFPENKTL